MPLDDLQKAVLAVLLRNRTPGSFFAGGSTLNRHAFRLSDDQDIFHAEGVDLSSIAERDVQALRGAGYAVDVAKKYEGFVEAYVGSAAAGKTKIQWVEAGSWSFFTPVPDPEYGYRLHIVDLAINKVLAAGGRREVRDFVDLALIHRYIIPLWQAVWAAPGKDENWSPLSLLEQIARKNNFRQEDINEAIASLAPVSAAEVGMIVRQAIDQARATFTTLADESAGSLLVDASGHLVSDYTLAASDEVRIIRPRRGGTWPSGPDIDHLLINGLIERFGRDGGKLLEADDRTVFGPSGGDQAEG